MATTNRQATLFGIEDWKQIYETYRDADFQSYNFETLRKSFIDYLKLYYPENYNDFVESSEFIALIDIIAFMGQSLSYRTDLNTRENFIDTAERKESVTNLAKLLSYTPKRNTPARGFIKVISVKTTEGILDYNRNNLSNVNVKWNDQTNPIWQERFRTIINAILVDSQTIGNPGNTTNILGVDTSEYSINTLDDFIPTISYSSIINNNVMDFEIVNATTINKDYIYEPAPSKGNNLNLIYRNDKLGFGSNNTGYFFYFKQGMLQNRDFQISEKLSNRTVDINITGINNTDVWVFKIDPETDQILEEWKQTESLYSSNREQNPISDRKLFSVTTRANDQITLHFGDGVFSEIPLGKFRVFARSSNGQKYIINASEMQNVLINVPYISRKGRKETATFELGLAENVSNADTTESIQDIKRKAPARFYTQNRMVNGEDYNNFPYSKFGSIVKSKAVNRTNIGTSRYLDLVDPTGKYSSINVFASDGMIYQDYDEFSTSFTFIDNNDVENVILNTVEPILSKRSTIHFYYSEYERKPHNETLLWNLSTSANNETTGYFMNENNTPVAIGSPSANNREFLKKGALIKFKAPTGYYFDKYNKLKMGTPSNTGEKYTIWAGIITLFNDGTNKGVGNDDKGIGPVILNDYVPTNAIAVETIPYYTNNLSPNLERAMVAEILNHRDFGVGYDYDTGNWYMITERNISKNEFSFQYAGDTSNTNRDSSWIVRFESDGKRFSIISRSLKYYFSSVSETRFFFDQNKKIYDSRNGKTISDHVKILKTNHLPDTRESLVDDIVFDIIDQPIEADGYVNDYNVEISYADFDNDGIPSDPDFFDTLVNPSINKEVKYVFFQRVQDFDNLEKYLPVSYDDIELRYGTKALIADEMFEFMNGQVFYAYVEDKFYKLSVTSIGRKLLDADDYIAKVGRGKLQFQYKHNSAENRRINPGISNIIDMYLVTAAYAADYKKYIQDTTGTVMEPKVPTMDELHTLYQSLNDYKMVGDNIVMHSVTFKPLFGRKADVELQGIIKVVRVPNMVVSDSELKSRVIMAINEYFDISNWDFGDTFYFSELSAFIHRKMGSYIGSIAIMPKNVSKKFGNLYEVKSAANEIFVSAATVDDVEIIDALSNSEIGL